MLPGYRSDKGDVSKGVVFFWGGEALLLRC